jgi:hypothetical protein
MEDIVIAIRSFCLQALGYVFLLWGFFLCMLEEGKEWLVGCFPASSLEHYHWLPPTHFVKIFVAHAILLNLLVIAIRVIDVVGKAIRSI